MQTNEKDKQLKSVNQKHKDGMTVTERIATVITDKIGTFSCFVFFAALACVSLPSVVHSHSTIIWVSWITQSFLQLVLLPLIMISQNIQSKHAELVADEDLEVNQKAEKENEEMIKKLVYMEQKIDKLSEWMGIVLKSELARVEREANEVPQSRRALR